MQKGEKINIKLKMTCLFLENDDRYNNDHDSFHHIASEDS